MAKGGGGEKKEEEEKVCSSLNRLEIVSHSYYRLLAKRRRKPRLLLQTRRRRQGVPHAQRMENLTWRMMALALKKKKEDEGREKERAKEKNRDAEAQKGGGPGSSQSSGEKAAEGTGPSTGGAETAQETERGRTIDKGKARVQVVGFDGANQDGPEENECVSILIASSSVLLSYIPPPISEVPMDWRAISRSRSRAPMDWRPASRSRSRPPMTGMSDLQNQFKFPSSSPPKRDVTSPSIPIPGSAGRRSPHPSVTLDQE